MEGQWKRTTAVQLSQAGLAEARAGQSESNRRDTCSLTIAKVKLSAVVDQALEQEVGLMENDVTVCRKLSWNAFKAYPKDKE